MAIDFQPYVGPRPFEQEDQALFFGRDGEADDLLSLVVSHEAVLLYAQAGAGKTSLINAGLIPLLEEEGFEILPLARVRGLSPERTSPKETNLYVFNTLMNWAKNKSAIRRLSQMSLAHFLKEREHLADEMGLPSPRVIIFDQFEELFAFYPERWIDRKDFFEQVRNALEEDPLLRVVFAIREDYIAQLDPYAPLLPDKLQTRFRLERLRERAALSAVTEPLRDTRRSFAEGVAEKLVEDLLKVRGETTAGEIVEVTGEFVEPVQLQVVCQSLWRDLPPDVTVITQDHLQTFGNVNQALSGFYERSIMWAAQEASVGGGDLREWFEHTLITPAGTRGTVYRGQDKTGGIPNAVVDVLENLHLIRGEWRAGARWYELTHDRFIGPIQKSNEARRAARKKRWLRIGISAAVVLVLFAGIAALQTIISKREIAQERAMATVAAQETGTAAAQAEATVVAQETAAAQAKATIIAQKTAAAQAVTSLGSLTNSATRTLQVGEAVSDSLLPKALITGPTSGRVGETLSFSGANSTDADGHIVSHIWDFGDGTTASGVDVTHGYRAPGTYKVTLTVTDDGGLSDTETYTIRVEPTTNQPPKAVISIPSTSSQAGEAVSFSAADSTDPDGYIKKYEWDFGDGTKGEGVNVTHAYKAPGTYNVTLTVTDDGDLSDSASEGGRGTDGVSIQQVSTETYTVQSGDTLMEISRKLFNGDPQYWDEIADLNDIRAPYTIYPGQELKVPKK